MARWFLVCVLALVAVVSLAAPGRVAQADGRDFTLINGDPTLTLRYLYVSPSSEQGWGADVLGPDLVLGPGERVFISFADVPAGACLYDIRGVYTDGSERVRYGVDLCQTDTFTLD